MNMPMEVPSPVVLAPENQRWWPIFEVSASFAPMDNLLIDAQVNGPMSIPFIVPLPVGIGLGGRGTVAKQSDSVPLSVDVMAHGYASKAVESASTGGTRQEGTATIAGGRVGLVLTRKMTDFFSASLAPYFRGFRFDTSLQSGTDPAVTAGGWLLAGGASLSLELKLGPFVVVPAFAVELDANPHGAGYFFIPSPGMQLGFRW